MSKPTKLDKAFKYLRKRVHEFNTQEGASKEYWQSFEGKRYRKDMKAIETIIKANEP